MPYYKKRRFYPKKYSAGYTAYKPKAVKYAPKPFRNAVRAAPYRAYKPRVAASTYAPSKWARYATTAASYAAKAALPMAMRGAARYLGAVTGLGDYTAHGFNVKSNAVTVPIVNSNGHQTSVCHREYIGDVISSQTAGNFKIQSHVIQPGSPSTFPWLHRLASAFQEYRIDGMLFAFESTSGDALNSVNTALGSVMMGTNYNSQAPDFGSKSDLANSQFATTFKPSKNCLHPIECSRRQTPVSELYVARGGVYPAGADRQLWDFAKFQIASSGCQGIGVVLGELWVSYKITFFKPIAGVVGLSNGDPQQPLEPQPPQTVENIGANFIARSQIQMNSPVKDSLFTSGTFFRTFVKSGLPFFGAGHTIQPMLSCDTNGIPFLLPGYKFADRDMFVCTNNSGNKIIFCSIRNGIPTPLVDRARGRDYMISWDFTYQTAATDTITSTSPITIGVSSGIGPADFDSPIVQARWFAQEVAAGFIRQSGRMPFRLRANTSPKDNYPAFSFLDGGIGVAPALADSSVREMWIAMQVSQMGNFLVGAIDPAEPAAI